MRNERHDHLMAVILSYEFLDAFFTRSTTDKKVGIMTGVKNLCSHRLKPTRRDVVSRPSHRVHTGIQQRVERREVPLPIAARTGFQPRRVHRRGRKAQVRVVRIRAHPGRLRDAAEGELARRDELRKRVRVELVLRAEDLERGSAPETVACVRRLACATAEAAGWVLVVDEPVLRVGALRGGESWPRARRRKAQSGEREVCRSAVRFAGGELAVAAFVGLVRDRAQASQR